jgi:sulfide:quinone oxidoreductase
MNITKHVVVLGAGFGGLTVATELDSMAGAGKIDVALVDRNTHFSMGFSMQWAMVGRRRPEDGQRPYTSFKARHAKFVHDEIVAIDTTSRTVRTRSRRLDYDYLVIALGAELAPELIPGLAEGAYNLCDLGSVMQLRAAVEGIDRGTLVVAVSSTPFKCPPAPYEYALLIDDMLRGRGVRDRVRIVVTTPEPQPMPVAGKAVGDAVKAMLADRGIEFLPGHKPKTIDALKRTATYENGTELTYDVLGAMPPHRAPRVVRDAGLADASGFVPVEIGSFKASAPDVYAVGDVASIRLPNGNPHPKAGVFAEAQAAVVAGNIVAELTGGQRANYAGIGACYVDVGRGQAAPAEADLLVASGPRVALRPPSAEGLEEKRRFERDRLSKWFGG